MSQNWWFPGIISIGICGKDNVFAINTDDDDDNGDNKMEMMIMMMIIQEDNDEGDEE